MTEEYLKTAARTTVDEEPSPNGRGTLFLNTDQGNAERLVAWHGSDLHYVYPWAKWATWTGKRWKIDDTGAVVRLAKNTVRVMFHEADRGDGHIDKALGSHALKCQSRARI